MNLKYFVLFHGVFLFAATLCGQSIISGRIVDDNNTPVPFATVVLFNFDQSIVLSHCISNDDGHYSIVYKGIGSYNLEVRCLGFIQQSKSITLDNDNNIKLDFTLTINSIGLPVFEIKEKAIGIQLKNDTIRYNTSVFTDGSEVMLEDVLKKLPSVDVDEQGNIQAHGKQVKKVLINGKDFFQDNTQLATENIPADIINNVDVLTNYSEYSMFEGFKSHEETVLDIGVKKDKLGQIIGNITTGVGYEKKYMLKGNLMQIKPKTMISLLGAMNNTGDEIFSFEDYFRLQGGVQSLVSSSPNSINLSGNEVELLYPDNNIFEKTAGMSAINIAYQPNAKFKLNSYVLFSENNSYSENNSKLNYIVPIDNNYYIDNRLAKTKNKTDLISGYLKMNYQYSKTLEIHYQGNVGFTKSNKNQNILNEFANISINPLENRLSTTPSTKQNIGIMKMFGKHMFVADAFIDYRSNDFFLDMELDSLMFPLYILPHNEKYYISQEEFSKQLRSTVDAVFLYKVGKLYFFKSGIHTSFNRQRFVSNIYQNNSFQEKIFLHDSLQNNHTVNMNDYNVDLIFTKNKKWLQFRLGAIAHIYEFYHNLHLSESLNTKTKFNIAPYLHFSLTIKKHHRINLTYEEEALMNSAKDFATGIILSNFQNYYIYSNLQHIYAIMRKISFFYDFSNHFSNTSLSLMGDYNRDKNSKTINFNQIGILTKYQNISSKEKDSYSAKLRFEQGIGNIPWKFKINTSYNHYSYFNQSFGFENKMITNYWQGRAQLQSQYRKFFNMEVMAGMEYNTNESLLHFVKMIQRVQKYSILFKFTIKERCNLETSLEYAVNDISGNRIEFYYLNTKLRYGIVKNKLDFEISGNNLLNLDKQEWMTITSNGVYVAENYFRTIPGYVLLKLTYKI